MSFHLKQTKGRFKAVVHSCNSDRLVDHFDEIEEDLRTLSISNGLILLDLYANNGKEKNRFIEVFFDGKNLKDSTTKIAKDLDPETIIQCNKFYCNI